MNAVDEEEFERKKMLEDITRVVESQVNRQHQMDSLESELEMMHKANLTLNDHVETYLAKRRASKKKASN